MTRARTYLDHNATAPLLAQARAAMLAALDLNGNASSVHAEGRRARGVVETAREQVAALVNAKPEEVVFTSGATEANNWVVRGGWDTLFVAAIEHDSVLAPARMTGARVVELPASPAGVARIGAIDTMAEGAGRALVCLQAANSETGVVQPVAEVASLARRQGLCVHTDAVQAAGRISQDFRALGIDFMSLSAHKIGGPKGVGALVVRDGVELAAFISGGGQERRRRAGTENIAAIAGFGAAATAAKTGLGAMARIRTLRDRLEDGVRALTPAVVVIGGGAGERLPNTSCIGLPGDQAATLLIKLDLAGIAISAGSACSSGKIGASHVLAAMAIDEAVAGAAVRISLGPASIADDIDNFLEAWAAIHQSSHGAPKPGEMTNAKAAAHARTRHEMRAGD